MKRLVPLAILCLTLQGCVGLVVSKTRTCVINEPEIRSSYIDAEEVRDWNSHEAIIERGGRSDYKPCTSQSLKANWGEPTCISRNRVNSDEIWTYKGGRVWEGVVPFVVIPIPFLLPVAREKVHFDVRDGHVVSARVTRSCTVLGTYGIIPNPEGGGSFGVWNWDDDPPSRWAMQSNE